MNVAFGLVKAVYDIGIRSIFVLGSRRSQCRLIWWGQQCYPGKDMQL